MYRYRTISIAIYRMFNQNMWYVVVWWEKNESYSPKIYRTIVTTTKYIAFFCWWLFVWELINFLCTAYVVLDSYVVNVGRIVSSKNEIFVWWSELNLFLTDFEKKTLLGTSVIDIQAKGWSNGRVKLSKPCCRYRKYVYIYPRLKYWIETPYMDVPFFLNWNLIQIVWSKLLMSKISWSIINVVFFYGSLNLFPCIYLLDVQFSLVIDWFLNLSLIFRIHFCIKLHSSNVRVFLIASKRLGRASFSVLFFVFTK